MNTILELNEKDKITGEIYLITNTVTNKKYIGQTRSHRLNKNKYRPFGTIGRFNDHISEAINNTKKNQCVYLNNAIRKYNRESFTVKMLETCDVNILNDREQHYITEYNTLYPNGYNLTKGGKTFYCNIVENNNDLNEYKKRGRDFGFKHKTETITKMKERIAEFNKTIIDKKINTMKDTMTEFYNNKKKDIISQYDLEDDIKQYIKPVYKKDTKIIHDYIIKINKRKLTCCSKNESLEHKYQRLFNILNDVKEAQKLKLLK